MKDNKTNAAQERCKDYHWLCDKCGKLLGFIDKETRKDVRIKYQDLYIYCKDAEEFLMTCRGCGNINRLEKVTSATKTIARVG